MTQRKPVLPAQPERRLRLCGSVLVGAVAAVALPLGSVGLGWLLVWSALAVLAWAAYRQRRTGPPTGTADAAHGQAVGSASTAAMEQPAGRTGSVRSVAETVVRLGLGILSGLLAAVGTVRAAGWLQTLCLLAGVLAASVALDADSQTAGRTWRGLFASFLTLPRGAADGVAALRNAPVASPPGALAIRAAVPPSRLASPTDLDAPADQAATGPGSERDTDGGSRPLLGAAIGVGVAVLLALVVGGLLGAADQQFARTVRDVLPSLSVGGVLLAFVSFGGAFALALGVVELARQRERGEVPAGRSDSDRTPIGLLRSAAGGRWSGCRR